MGKIQFGSEVYTWFMQGTGKGYDNKLDHMIKVASEAGFTGIEPMALEISQSVLGCSKYWLGPQIDPIKMKGTLQQHNMRLCGLALVCTWDDISGSSSSKSGQPPQTAAQAIAIRSGTTNHFQLSDRCGRALYRRNPSATGAQPLSAASYRSRSGTHGRSREDARRQVYAERQETSPPLNRRAFSNGQRSQLSSRERESDTDWFTELAPPFDSPPAIRRHHRGDLDTSTGAFCVSALDGCCCEAALN